MQTAYKQMDIETIMKPVKLKAYRVRHGIKGYPQESEVITAETATKAVEIIKSKYPHHRASKAWLINK